MLFPLEIWREIIGYFGYPQDKRILRALAVVSHSISDLALNIIWCHDRNNLSKIVSVINSFAPPPQSFLEYIPGSDYDDDDGSQSDVEDIEDYGAEEATPFGTRELGSWVSA